MTARPSETEKPPVDFTGDIPNISATYSANSTYSVSDAISPEITDKAHCTQQLLKSFCISAGLTGIVILYYDFFMNTNFISPKEKLRFIAIPSEGTFIIAFSSDTCGSSSRSIPSSFDIFTAKSPF